MQQQKDQAHPFFSQSGLLDPEQYEHQYTSNMRLGLKGDTCSPRELLCPWEDNKLPRRRKQHLNIQERIESLQRPRMAQTDRTGKFRSIFDIGEFNRTRSNFKDVTSKIDNKWDGYSNTLDHDTVKKHKSNPKKQIKLPKPLTAKVFELETSEGLPLSLDQKRFPSPTKLSSKKHLIQNIDYREIEESMFNRPSLSNRFSLLCKTLETKPIGLPQPSTSDRIRVINFPITQDEIGEKNVKKQKERDFRSTKHSFTNSFYLRSKLHKEKRLSELGIEYPMPDRPVDFKEILNEKNQLRIINAKRRKSRIFSMVLRI